MGPPLKVRTCVVRWANACVVVDPVHTGGAVFTVIILTVIWVDLTSLSLKAQGAGAALEVCGERRGFQGQGTGRVVEVGRKVGGQGGTENSLSVLSCGWRSETHWMDPETFGDPRRKTLRYLQGHFVFSYCCSGNVLYLACCFAPARPRHLPQNWK